MPQQTVKQRPLIDGLRRQVAVGLEKARLERPAYRLLERAQTLRALPERFSANSGMGSDGLALPPPLLRIQVSGEPRADAFLEQSERGARNVADAAHRAGREINDFEAILDFGCGCGRVMRRWVTLTKPRLFGSDYNPKLVEWCQKNLPFATFRANGLAPPLPFDDDQFDFVYSLSVFTHLTEELQHDWIAELARVIRPGGLLLFTTRGESWAWKLNEDERARFDAGELVVRYSKVAGTNLCATFHPWDYVHNRLANGFRVVGSYQAALEDGAQDIHLFERTD